jgi:hypothetical protein
MVYDGDIYLVDGVDYSTYIWWKVRWIYPLVNLYITMENHHFMAGKIKQKFYGHFQ